MTTTIKCEKCGNIIVIPPTINSDIDSIKKVAQHFYHEAILFGTDSSDREWIEKYPWLEE